MNTATEILYGLCQCGCGNKTLISTVSCANRGLVKGQPLKFIRGHNMRSNENQAMYAEGKCKHSDGYIWQRCEDHPRAHNGYVLEHVLVAEQKLGRFLLPEEEVHHENEIKSDNRPENLTVFPNTKAHQQHHVRMTALKACGNPDWRRCRYCHNYDDVSNLKVAGRSFYHWPCRKIAERTAKLKEKN